MRAHRGRSAVRRPWPAPSRDAPGSHNRRSWTEPWEPCGLRAADRVSYSASRSQAGRSLSSTWSPTRRASAGSTWLSSTTDEPATLRGGRLRELRAVYAFRRERDPVKETPVATVVAGLSISLGGVIAHL